MVKCVVAPQQDDEVQNQQKKRILMRETVVVLILALLLAWAFGVFSSSEQDPGLPATRTQAQAVPTDSGKTLTSATFYCGSKAVETLTDSETLNGFSFVLGDVRSADDMSVQGGFSNRALALTYTYTPSGRTEVWYGVFTKDTLVLSFEVMNGRNNQKEFWYRHYTHTDATWKAKIRLSDACPQRR